MDPPKNRCEFTLSSNSPVYVRRRRRRRRRRLPVRGHQLWGKNTASMFSSGARVRPPARYNQFGKHLLDRRGYIELVPVIVRGIIFALAAGSPNTVMVFGNMCCAEATMFWFVTSYVERNWSCVLE